MSHMSLLLCLKYILYAQMSYFHSTVGFGGLVHQTDEAM